MHLRNRWGDWFRGSDYAQIGSVKLLEDADSIGYDPDTKHLYVTNGAGGRTSSMPSRVDRSGQ